MWFCSLPFLFLILFKVYKWPTNKKYINAYLENTVGCLMYVGLQSPIHCSPYCTRINKWIGGLQNQGRLVSQGSASDIHSASVANQGTNFRSEQFCFVKVLLHLEILSTLMPYLVLIIGPEEQWMWVCMLISQQVILFPSCVWMKYFE